MTLQAILRDLQDRVQRAEKELNGLARNKAPGDPERYRLIYKAQGVRMVGSYIDEAIRIIPPEDVTGTPSTGEDAELIKVLIVTSRDDEPDDERVNICCGHVTCQRVISEYVRDKQAVIDRLNRWKAEALPVLDGLQGLGKALDLPLGTQTTGTEALLSVRALIDDRDSLRETLASLRGLVSEHRRTVTPAPYTTERALIERLTSLIPPTGDES